MSSSDGTTESDSGKREETHIRGWPRHTREAALANWKVLKITCPWFVVHAFIFAAQAWSVELVYFLEGMEYMEGLHMLSWTSVTS
ncbi:hypothetical protein FOZ62_015726 [Perkinsus olseni]|uniref:Uncharacterized protein n=1 Tax=Perkinsus olseni TaxID=32597 RepID=A0A7J6SVI4_PEROL|nr:hypothetical protein FOZ62_015726 [Perkinsus olseni]